MCSVFSEWSANLTVSMRRSVIVALLIVNAACSLVQAETVHTDALSATGQKFVEWDHCQLDSGESIEACRLGYRTFGSLNADRTNAVLVPTWFTGDSQSHSFLVNGDLIDPQEYFVVIVDALGNGVSSSPSNSESQAGEGFPLITIRDMVRSQHRLLTEQWGIESLHAIVGLSMGGMQAFEWAVSYPGVAEKTVAVIGSPRLQSFDIALWETRNRLLALYRQCQCDDAAVALEGLSFLLQVPEKVEQSVARDSMTAELAKRGDDRLISLSVAQTWDQQRQAEAMIAHNMFLDFNNNQEETVSALKGDFLIIVGADDRVVTPEPAVALGARIGAQVEVLDNDCGHSEPQCAPDEFARLVRSFLSR